MTDKELLELAAKAAGITIDKSPNNGGGFGNDGFSITGAAAIDWHNGVFWNPLNDDGDALRLAVKLSISIISPHNIENTRREIVQAAAEIGSHLA